MSTAQELQKKLADGGYDTLLTTLYGAEALAGQKQRYAAALTAFDTLFPGQTDVRLFSAPGRTEIGGNHTDHNHGRVLAAGIDLDVIAVASPCQDRVCVHSEGFDPDDIAVDDRTVHTDETGKSASLLRGTLAGFVENGHRIGGFCAYTTSRVLKGSGLSSSAAFEVLCGTVLNYFYNDGTIPAPEIARIAQYAESAYFGKPCGLMDQTASAVGGIVTIDFRDTDHPVIRQIPFDFAATGYTLCIVDTGGNHANLTPEYAAVPAEMKAVAAALGVTYLRETDRETLLRHLPSLRQTLGDRAVLRALHFLEEDPRVERQVAALEQGDFEGFLALILESGHSSFEYLQNVYPAAFVKEQGLSLALCLSQHILNGRGAFRVHGGGFAGTIQCFVPNDLVDTYCASMQAVFGETCCYRLRIRPCGGICLDE